MKFTFIKRAVPSKDFLIKILLENLQRLTNEQDTQRQGKTPK